MFIQVEHTYTVYSHSLDKLQIIELSPFILTASPPPQKKLKKKLKKIDMSFTKIQLCSKYFNWATGEGGGGHGLIKSFLISYMFYIKYLHFYCNHPR